jgi:hypothetical protein
MTPVFIIAAPRSGTTWLVRALNAHPEAYATEIRGFGDYVDVIQDSGAAKPRLRITLDKYVDALMQPHQWSLLGDSREAVRDELLHDIYETIARHALRRSGKRFFIDKLTPYLGTSDLAIASIARLFPDAKIILLMRDGRDVAVSGVMHWLTKQTAGGEWSDQQRARRAFFLEHAAASPDRFFTDAELEAWANHWREVIHATCTHMTQMRLLLVRYEDMSRNLGGELRRICTFIGADASDAAIASCVADSTFEKMSGGRQRGEDAPGQHVRKGVVGDWRMYFTAADAALFDRLAGWELIDEGYESPDPAGGWVARAPERLRLDQPGAALRI